MFDGPWNTCMLVRGLNPAECSGWVQAWGSIAAILVAASIAWVQIWKARVAEREKDRVSSRARLMALAVILTRALDAMNLARKIVAEQRHKLASLGTSDIQNARALIDRVPLFDVPFPSLVLALQTAHRELHQVQEICTIYHDEAEASSEKARLTTLELIDDRRSHLERWIEDCKARAEGLALPSKPPVPAKANSKSSA